MSDRITRSTRTLRSKAVELSTTGINRTSSRSSTRSISDKKRTETTPEREGKRTPTKSKSPSRTAPKSPSRSAPKSPSRTARKSPVRVAPKSPSRVAPKSPARATRNSPARVTRNSPSRIAALTPEDTVIRRRSPGRYRNISTTSETKLSNWQTRNKINVPDSESDSDMSSFGTRTRESFSKESSIDILNNLRSRVSRQREPSLPDRVVPLLNNVNKRIAEFSGDEEDGRKFQQSRSSAKRISFGSIVFVMIFACFELMLILGLPLLCNEKQCEFRMPSMDDLHTIIGAFNLSVLYVYSGFILFNAILSIVPFGGRKQKSMASRDENFEYVLNALFSLILQILIIVALEVYHIPVTMYIINNYFSFIIATVVFSLIFSWFSLLLGTFCSQNGCMSTSHFYNFIMGGQINPRIGDIDVKFVMVRCCIISTILMILSMVYQSTEMIALPPNEVKMEYLSFALVQSIRIRPTLFIISTLICIYWGDLFCFEDALLSTKDFKETPWGFLKMNEYLGGSFIYCLLPKYVYNYNVELETWQLAVSTAIFMIGYIIYRGSNSQKHAFRKNPYSIVFAKYESIPTTLGKKILCSGYWGYVRHPNYLGDIILSLSYIPFVGLTPPFVFIVFMVCSLALRAIEDGQKCKERYGLAWDRYCQRVPYYLIPKIF